MKKLISFVMVLILMLFTIASAAAASLKSFSLLSPQVVSIMLTNTVGITNLAWGSQIGGIWTNGPGNAQANGTFMTNFSALAGANTLYTQRVNSAIGTLSGLTINGTNLPGVLVVNVTTNTANTAGVFGYPPFGTTNLTWAKTNDALNLFQDVKFNDINLDLGFNGGPNTTNLACAMALEVGLQGGQLNGSGSGSNYVTITLAPLASDGSQINNTELAGNAAGAFMSLVPFSVNVTNAASTTATCTAIIPIPASYFIGASGVRVFSATPGVAWSTGGSMWLTRLNLIYQTTTQ